MQNKLTTKEINQLDDLLLELYPEVDASYEGEEHVFSVSMLDGYLTAVLLAPFPIEEELWVEGLWQEDNPPVFQMPAQKKILLDAIKKHYLYIENIVNGDLVEFEPLTYYAADNKQLVPQIDLWIDGFARGVDYFEKCWRFNKQIDEVIDLVLAFDDNHDYDNLSLDQRNKVLPKLGDYIIQLHALNKSHPNI